MQNALRHVLEPIRTKIVHVDEVIELAGQKDKKFKVIELRPDQVVIEEIGTRRPLTIPKR